MGFCAYFVWFLYEIFAGTKDNLLICSRFWKEGYLQTNINLKQNNYVRN